MPRRYAGEISKHLDRNPEELLPDKIPENVVFRRVADTATGPASVDVDAQFFHFERD